MTANDRMRPSACDTLSRLCVRRVLCWPAFPSVPALGSTDSAAGCSALFVGFSARMAECDFSRSCISGAPFCSVGTVSAAGSLAHQAGAVLIKHSAPDRPAAFQASVSNLRNRINRMALDLNPPTQREKHATLLHFTIGAAWPSAADTWRCAQPLIAGTTVIPHHALPAKVPPRFPGWLSR